jgi:hypothetical protein
LAQTSDVLIWPLNVVDRSGLRDPDFLHVHLGLFAAVVAGQTPIKKPRLMCRGLMFRKFCRWLPALISRFI